MDTNEVEMTTNSIALDSKVAIVTGAAVGMGYATARLLALRGAKVIVSDVNEVTGMAAARDICDAGGLAHFIAADVSEEGEVAALVAKTVALHGRLDCAINNAGIAPDRQPIHDADMALFDRVLGVNLRSVMLCMKYQIRQMLAQGTGGSIVNIGSVSSVRPQPQSAAYVAAKHGLVGLTKAGSLDYAGHNIRINAVLPGTIDTPMLRTAMAANGRTEAEFASAFSLFGRFGTANEVAEASAWLCCEASSFITGHSLAVDGGYLSR